MFRACIDIGGTFTDCVVLDERGNLGEFKAPSTPADFSEGVLNALNEAAAAYADSPEEFIGNIGLIVHGTTVATNALVTRNIAKTAMITTKGFRDIIEMRRCLKIETKSMYDAFIPPYEAIVPRYLRLGVEEETRYTGEVTKPVNEAELMAAIAKLKAEKVAAVAVCFINAYANADNERRAAEICQREMPDVFVNYSADILPKMGEYERESTCVISACVGPVVKRYMSSLEKRLAAAGFKGQLLIMQANQYTQSVAAVTRKPAYLMGSGPAAAPAGGAHLGKSIKEKNLITIDMGGTTLDSSLIKAGEVSLATGQWLGEERLGIKVVDVESIGAGGGSIAWINQLGLLQVGPQSAGAEPGPVCYGRGGTEPTVTDAAAILGYIPADYFWGGKLKLDVPAARKAMQKIADALKMSVEEAALATFTTVNVTMANGVTAISTRKGYDVRDFGLMAFGGGGPLCGAFIARILGMKKVIVPKFAASFSAWSMFSLDIGRDYVRSYFCPLSEADPAAINQLYQEMMDEALEDLRVLDVSHKDVKVSKLAEVRYEGQYHEVEMEFGAGEITVAEIAKLAQDFHKRHEKLYTFSMPWVPIDVRTLRLIAKIPTDKIRMKHLEAGTPDAGAALKGRRPCYFEGQREETSIYDSTKLKSGNVITGPAVVESPVTTLVIPRGFDGSVDTYGNYILREV